jgi:hypothetical protein
MAIETNRPFGTSPARSVASETIEPRAVCWMNPRMTSRISRYTTITSAIRMTRLISCCSGVRTRRKVLAPAVICCARPAVLTFSTT